MTLVLVYLTAGAAAGFLSGVFGIGGGLIIVPMLLFALGLQGVSEQVAIHIAIASSLATIVVTAISSVRAHWRRGNILWPVFRSLALGMLAGAFLGAQVTGRLPADTLRVVFACFTLGMAARMLLAGIPEPGHRPGSALVNAAVGGVIGTASSVVGIGGGSMTVPYLAWRGVPMRQAVGTSSACGLPIALAGTLGYVVAGATRDLPLPAFSTGFIHWPSVLGITVVSVFTAPLGAAVASRIPQRYLRRAFAGFLLLVGTDLLLAG